MSCMARAHSTPLIWGISTSRNTTLGLSCSVSFNVVFPSPASATSVKPSTFAIILRITVRMPASSSAMSTRSCS